MTFGEAVAAVFTRCSVSPVGSQAAMYLGLVQEFVRSAHTQLYPEAEWTPAIKRADIDLADGVKVYDWPDDMLPGQLNSASVVNSDGREVEVEISMIRPNERSAALTTDGVARTGLPVLLTFVNGGWELNPAPNADWVTLRVDYLLSVGPLRDDAELLIVDGELVVQSATMKFKRHLGILVDKVDVAEHERYLARVKGMQSNGTGLQLGGHQSYRTHVQKRNRIAYDRNVNGSQAPYSTEWNPY